jgi:hypothetical protein
MTARREEVEADHPYLVCERSQELVNSRKTKRAKKNCRPFVSETSAPLQLDFPSTLFHWTRNLVATTRLSANDFLVDRALIFASNSQPTISRLISPPKSSEVV